MDIKIVLMPEGDYRLTITTRAGFTKTVHVGDDSRIAAAAEGLIWAAYSDDENPFESFDDQAARGAAQISADDAVDRACARLDKTKRGAFISRDSSLPALASLVHEDDLKGYPVALANRALKLEF